jgi:hypothetical protein
MSKEAVRRIVQLELGRRQSELDAAQRYADECAERHEAAMRRLQIARAEVVAVTEAKYSIDFNDGSGM